MLGVQVFTTYDCIRSDFTPRPIFPFAHLLKRILLRKAKYVASKWLGQSAPGFLKRGFEYSAGYMNTIPLSNLLVLPLTKGFGPSLSKAHPGAAGKDNKIELRRQNI